MDVEAVEIFTSVLALVTLAGAVLLVVARLLSSRVPLAYQAGSAVADAGLWLWFLVAAGATAGSLYFSEWPTTCRADCAGSSARRCTRCPSSCSLPRSVATGACAGTWFRSRPWAPLVSSYHYLLEWKPSLEGGACAAVGPACADIWFREFGFVTLAFMALAGFITIIVFSLVSFPAANDRTPLQRTELS